MENIHITIYNESIIRYIYDFRIRIYHSFYASSIVRASNNRYKNSLYSTHSSLLSPDYIRVILNTSQKMYTVSCRLREVNTLRFYIFGAGQEKTVTLIYINHKLMMSRQYTCVRLYRTWQLATEIMGHWKKKKKNDRVECNYIMHRFTKGKNSVQPSHFPEYWLVLLWWFNQSISGVNADGSAKPHSLIAFNHGGSSWRASRQALSQPLAPQGRSDRADHVTTSRSFHGPPPRRIVS